MNKEDIKIGDYVYTNWQRKYIIAKVLEIRGETIYGILELVSKLPEEKTDESVYNIELNTDKTFLGHLNIDEIYKLNFKNEMITCCRLKYSSNLNLGNIKVGDYIKVKNSYFNLCKVYEITNNTKIHGIFIPMSTIVKMPTNKKVFDLLYKKLLTAFGKYGVVHIKDVEKLKFEDEKIKEYQQQILDKLTVLSCEINFALDTGNKESFEVYCKEYNKINEQLNNNKMEVI